MLALQVSADSPRKYAFGDFQVDVLQRSLSCRGTIIPLPSRAFSLLLVLVRHAGECMSKDSLIKAVWPDAHVEACNLTQSIFLLRRALGQENSDYRYVVTVPCQGYVFAGNVTASPNQAPRRPSLSGRRVRSLAVIPFRILSAPKSLHYLGVGIADTLTNRLSHIEDLQVRPTSTTLSMMSKDRDALAVGRELAVELILTGTVQISYEKPRSASCVRVSLQLVDALDSNVIWSGTLEQKLGQILPLQDTLSEKIGSVLSERLSPKERGHLTHRPTEHPEAYQAYLKGRFYASQWTERGWKKAVDCFTQAVQSDPTFALAFSGIADAHYIASNLYSAPNDVMPKAKTAVESALELSPSLAEAHTSLALIEGFFDWNWEASEDRFRHAITLNPGYASAHLWYGRLLTARGRFDEAHAELKQAQQLDPVSGSINSEIGRALFYAGRYKEASDQLHEMLELNPAFWPAHLFLGWVYEQQGLFTEALALLKQCNSLDDNPRTRAFLGVSYALAGQTGEAERIIGQLIHERSRRYVPGYYIAILYAALGNNDLAFRWFDKACSDRSEWLAWLGVEPRVDMLREDPRFDALIKKVGAYTGSPVSAVAERRLISH
jgi:DNA-binding winged helix-turn-helix (wHTH) protein/Flp pilus assembly protein TadD